MNSIIRHETHTFQVRIQHDSDAGLPWENSDGHGPVSEWTSRAKRPGEWVLCADHGKSRFYDAQEAQRIALNDQWGIRDADKMAGMTRGQIAAAAVKDDFDCLADFCADLWSYVGCVVTLLDDDGESMDESESLWGIESNADEYLEQVAHELANEILSRLESTLAA